MHQHDRDAFDAFVRARLPDLLRLGRALTGSEEAGADLVRDALERTLLDWSRIESADPEGYARQLMVRRAVSGRHPPGHHQAPPASGPPGEQRYDAEADPGDDQDLWSALAELPPRLRAVVALRHLEGLPDEPIAELIRAPVGTVGDLARQAMETLRRSVSDTTSTADGPDVPDALDVPDDGAVDRAAVDRPDDDAAYRRPPPGRGA